MEYTALEALRASTAASTGAFEESVYRGLRSDLTGALRRAAGSGATSLAWTPGASMQIALMPERLPSFIDRIVQETRAVGFKANRMATGVVVFEWGAAAAAARVAPHRPVAAR